MRRFLAALAVLGLTACISDSVGVGASRATGVGTGGTSSPSSSVPGGTFTLKTAAGAPLPYTYAGSGADKSEILDDAFTLTDSSWTEVGTVRRTVAGTASVIPITDAGTLTKAPNGQVVLSTPRNTTYSGTLNGNTLTLNGNSPSGAIVPLVYIK
jgi:hypothetical protein